MPPVRTEREGPVLTITIDRPDKRNAIDGATADALLDAWELLRDDEELAAGVLAGAGEAFCAGADLGALETLGPGIPMDEDEREAFLTGQDGYLGPTRRTDLGKPLIAAVEGPARAGGVEMACLADLRIADPSASFGLTNRRWGVPLVDGGTQRLPRIVGLGRALELVLTGKVIDAQRAYEIGLVNEVVEAGQAVDRARDLAETIAGFPTEALWADREATYAAPGTPLEDGLEVEARLGQQAIEREGFLEDTERFFEE